MADVPDNDVYGGQVLVVLGDGFGGLPPVKRAWESRGLGRGGS